MLKSKLLLLFLLFYQNCAYSMDLLRLEAAARYNMLRATISSWPLLDDEIESDYEVRKYLEFLHTYLALALKLPNPELQAVMHTLALNRQLIANTKRIEIENRVNENATMGRMCVGSAIPLFVSSFSLLLNKNWLLALPPYMAGYALAKAFLKTSKGKAFAADYGAFFDFGLVAAILLSARRRSYQGCGSR